jgi:ribosomal protein S17E
VAQDVGPAFKPQYCLKKEKKNSGQPGYITRLYLKKKKKKARHGSSWL